MKRARRLAALLLAAALCAGLAACGGAPAAQTPAPTPTGTPAGTSPAAAGTGEDYPDTDEEVLEGILANFELLAAVPRPSHHEEKIGAFLMSWAEEQGFEPRMDETGNVIFDIPATEGHEDAPLVVLQAHMDMVAVSSDPDFDPLNTPIKTIRTDETLTADGTSLGADDGIGVSAIMYCATSAAEHGPLRAIFTVDEEDGLEGVYGLDASVVADAQYLLNLDAEALGEAVVSTAGGLITSARQEPRRTAPALDTALSLTIDGLLGGHSGVMIGEGRINAVRAMAELLLCLRVEGIGYELASFSGGTANNSIPTSASALIVLASDDAQRAEELLRQRAGGIAEACEDSDPDMSFDVSPAQLPETVFEAGQAEDIVNFAALVFNGLGTMSQSVEGLVESSSNLGVIRADENEVSAGLYPRSSQAALLDSIDLQQRAMAELCGFTMSSVKASDAWPAETDSELQDIMKEVYLEETGEELKLICVHAGLECGTFARLNPELDMVSIGPELHDVHSVKETLYLDSVVPFYRLLQGTLLRLAK